ncbi:MAG: hypothetical protein ACR2PT_08940 [Endozoicomonas sp.]
MSLESQLLNLKAKQSSLDEAFHEFHKIVQGTQDVVALTLKEQREYFGKTDYRLNTLAHSINNLENSMSERFLQQDRRLDKIEETLIQIVNHLIK